MATTFRMAVWAAAFAATALAAGDGEAVSKAAERVRATAAKAPPAIGREFCSMAAKALAGRYPTLSKELTPGANAAVSGAGTAAPRPAAGSPEVDAIRKQIGQMRSLATDAERARLAIEMAAKIRDLPPGPGKLMLARGLGNLVTEGDLGPEALAAVAGALADALPQTPGDAGAYLELASLVRYEGVPALASDPSFDAADAVLALEQALIAENDFKLTGMDGKVYSLSGLRGHIVLLNFWATWCPPCRKEMPDLQGLYNSYSDQGLIVLAVSDEPRETVAGFLAKQNYGFPVLLDPDHSVHNAFYINGIPKTFVFGRDGRLAAQAIDMRTEHQFQEMLRKAGL